MKGYCTGYQALDTGFQTFVAGADARFHCSLDAVGNVAVKPCQFGSACKVAMAKSRCRVTIWNAEMLGFGVGIGHWECQADISLNMNVLPVLVHCAH